METAKISRYTPSHDTANWAVYVGNAWGLFTVHVRATKVDGAGKPTFAPCPP